MDNIQQDSRGSLDAASFSIAPAKACGRLSKRGIRPLIGFNRVPKDRPQQYLLGC